MKEKTINFDLRANVVEELQTYSDLSVIFCIFIGIHFLHKHYTPKYYIVVE